MSHEDHVFTLLVESNPVPQIEDLDLVDVGGARYLTTLEQRSSEMTQQDRIERDNTKKKNPALWLVAAAVVVVAGVGVIFMNQGDENPVGSPATSTTATPSTTTTAPSTTTTVVPAEVAAVIEGYIAAYNGGDIGEVMAHFSEDSVITGHPTDLNRARGSSNGLTEIRALHVEDMTAAASEDAYTISNLEVTGTSVTWDHVWVNKQGTEFCKSGQTAVVEDGVILSWTWAGGGFDCP